MDDDTLAPFVDALAGGKMVLVLVAVFFIVQNAMIVIVNIKGVAVEDLKSEDYNPIDFRPPLSIDVEKRELTYYLAFTLDESALKTIREDIQGMSHLHINVTSSDGEEKSTANLVRFLAMLDVPESITVSTNIGASQNSISRITWENK